MQETGYSILKVTGLQHERDPQLIRPQIVLGLAFSLAWTGLCPGRSRNNQSDQKRARACLDRVQFKAAGKPERTDVFSLVSRVKCQAEGPTEAKCDNTDT
jgi:hypothetical protein